MYQWRGRCGKVRYNTASLLSIVSCLALVSQSEASCRSLKFTTMLKGKTLTNHTIRTIQPIRDDQTCKIQCYLEPLCFAVNVCRKPDGSEIVCDLLNSTATIVHDQDLVHKQECTLHISKSSCSSSPCPSNASCHGDFLEDSVPYKCVCPTGFTGQFCETDIDECAPNAGYCHENARCNNSIGSYSCRCEPGYQSNGKTCQDIDECESNTHDCDPKAICNNTAGGYTCTCKPGLLGNGTFCRYLTSCEDVEKLPNSEDGFYDLKTASGSMVETLCVLSASQRCGSTNWKLALKIDGSKTEYDYSSTLWTDESAINPSSYKNAFENNSNTDIKLPAFWTHSVNKLCLGMKVSGVLNWISVAVNSTSSLRSLFASEQEIQTNSGKALWASLLSDSSLQRNCNREGLNRKCASQRTRLGLLANNEDDCNTCDTYIGFGLGPKGCGYQRGPSSAITCYILVQ